MSNATTQVIGDDAAKAESLTWKDRLQRQIGRGLSMAKTGASKLAEGARWFARHLLVKVIALVLLALALGGFIWLLAWVGGVALAASPWWLAAFVFFTWYIDLSVIASLLIMMYRVLTFPTM